MAMATTGIRGVFMEGTKVSVVVITEAITPPLFPPSGKELQKFCPGSQSNLHDGNDCETTKLQQIWDICIPRTKILSFKVSLLIGSRPEVERGVAHLVVHGTTGSTSYETIPPVPPETSGGVLSTVDMVVQRRDGRRRICDNDVDDDERSGPPTFTRCRRFPEPESWRGFGQTAVW